MYFNLPSFCVRMQFSHAILHPSSDIREAASTISDLCSRTGVELPIKTDQGGSPVEKQEAELVPGSEMKIRIETESSISPRIKAELGVSPWVKVEPGISPQIKAEPGVSPRVKVEPGISPTISQDAASPGNILLPRGNDVSNHEKTCSWK